jgi:hypothetical protein
MGWTPPRRPWCARVVVSITTEQEASVSEATTIGLDGIVTETGLVGHAVG